jgi:hypothetical protein
MVSILVRTRLRPPVQLFQAFSQFIPERQVSITQVSITMCAVWAVDSQAGQQVTN